MLNYIITLLCLSGICILCGRPCGLLSFTDFSWCHFDTPNSTELRLGASHIWNCWRKPLCLVLTDSVLINNSTAAIRCLHWPSLQPEGRGFDSLWCHWNFSLTYSFRAHYGPGVDSACDRNEYQEYFLWGEGGRCVGLITLPLSWADCLEIWEPQPSGTLRACPGL